MPKIFPLSSSHFLKISLLAMAGCSFCEAAAIPIPIAITNGSFEANRNTDQLVGGFANGESRDFGPNGTNDAVETGDQNRITGWTTITTENSGVDGTEVAVGFKNIVPAEPAAGATPNPQALSLMSGASIAQVTSQPWATLTAGEYLKMTVAIGDRTTVGGTTWGDQSFFGITDGLAAGSLTAGTLRSQTVANSGEILTPPAGGHSGTMADVTLYYKVLPSDLSRDGNVGVVLAGFGTTGTGPGTASNVNQTFFDHVRLERQAEDPPPPPVLPVATGPNILFIFFDDLRWDSEGFSGNKVVTTPNMDALAAKGTVFENSFSTTAICVVSRASVFTGQHMARHGINAFNLNISAANWQNAYPKKLKDEGYYLGFIGKHGLGPGFTGLYGTYDFNKSWDDQGTYFNQVIDGEPANGRHSNKFVGDLAVQFLGNTVDPAKNPRGSSFALQISFKAPHVEDTADGGVYLPDPAYDNLYTGDKISHAKTDTQPQFDALPAFFRAASAEGTIRWNKRFSTEENFQENIKKYYRLIHGADVEIGRIMETLDDPNHDGDHSDSQVANTVIVIGADHGVFLGERHQADKFYIQEEAIRTPLVIIDPRLSPSLKNKHVSQMALNIDIPATILDYAGVAQPAVMQGHSLRPIVEGHPPAGWQTSFLHHHPAVGGGVFANEGVRTETFSFTRYPSNGNVKQLYDITVDPYQRTNLAPDPRYAAKLAELDALTTQLKLEAQ